jgi:hypothetical protein
MHDEHVTDHLRVPRPFVLGVRGAVDADITVAGADEALERGLLLVIERIAGREQENDDLVFREVFVLEDEVRVLGPEHIEIMELAESFDCCHALVDCVVMPACGLRKERNVELLRRADRRHQAADDRGGEHADPFHLGFPLT